MHVVIQLFLRLAVTIPRQELDDQRILDCEDRVIVEILAGLVEDLSGDGLVSFGQDLLQSLAQTFCKRGCMHLR